MALAETNSSLRSEPLQEADQLLTEQTRSGEIKSAVLLVRRGAGQGAPVEFCRAYGAARMDTPFLLGSPSKPITASAVLLLADAGELRLADPVCRFLPEFTGDGRERITVKHLLTHTSGLPDMLPENAALRMKHAPMSEFVACTCSTPILFPAGERVSYQSMGTLLAAAIVEKITARPLREFLKERIFDPLGMARTSLGPGGRKISETAQAQTPQPTAWDWNSEYWRHFGAPWGGVHSTAADMARFIERFVADDPSPWKAETARAMRSLQTAGLNERWGLGWMLQASAPGKPPSAPGQCASTLYVESCSLSAFGHYGTPGTNVWRDPERDLTCVLLTTRPCDNCRAHVLGTVSDWVAQSAM